MLFIDCVGSPLFCTSGFAWDVEVLHPWCRWGEKAGRFFFINAQINVGEKRGDN
jgi:hypothetical protein